MRPTDKKTITIEDTLLLTVPKRRGHMCHTGATKGSTRVSQEAEGTRGKHGKKHGFHRKELVKQGK